MEGGERGTDSGSVICRLMLMSPNWPNYPQDFHQGLYGVMEFRGSWQLLSLFWGKRSDVSCQNTFFSVWKLDLALDY